MEFFRDTSFDFMGSRKIWLMVSTLAVILSLVAIFVQKRINVGIDFVGGTQLTLRFAEPPDVVELRRQIEAAGISEPRIQSIGEEEDHESNEDQEDLPVEAGLPVKAGFPGFPCPSDSHRRHPMSGLFVRPCAAT